MKGSGVLAVLAALACPGVAAGAGLGICEVPVWSVEGTQPDGRFGTVAPAGDVNGDGFDDVLVGAYNLSQPEVGEGVVFLYLGGPGGLSAVPAWSAGSNQPGARMGDKLSGAGDVNGDGFDDAIIGAGLYDSLGVDVGAAFLYLGSPAGLSQEPAWIAVGDQAEAQFGACVQAAGDVNGDGFGDVIVGAWLYDHGETNEGRAYVYLGSPGGLSTTPVWIGESHSVGAVYGYFCASAGDVDGDGFDEIVVGARRFSGNGLVEEGRVYVFPGTPAGPSPVASWVRGAGQARSEFGAYTIGAGDVNGDGFDDLLVGAYRWEGPALDEGKAWLFPGSATGLDTTAAWEVEGGLARNQLGYHLDGAGDVNGDGYDDVILSAPGVDTGGFTWANAGEAYVYLGSAVGLAATPAWTQSGDQAEMLLEAVRGVGDVNGDGFDEVATGALYRDGAFADAGRAWVFYGCSKGRTDVPEPGVVASPQLSIEGRNPFSRSIRLAVTLPREMEVSVVIHDVRGRRLATLAEGTLPAGRHERTWEGGDARGVPAPAGVYLVSLEAGEVRRVARLIKAGRQIIP